MKSDTFCTPLEQVRVVRDLRQVDLVEGAGRDAGRHPVAAGHDDVEALAGLDLGPPLVVLGIAAHVVDADAGLLLELGDQLAEHHLVPGIERDLALGAADDGGKAEGREPRAAERCAGTGKELAAIHVPSRGRPGSLLGHLVCLPGGFRDCRWKPGRKEIRASSGIRTLVHVWIAKNRQPLAVRAQSRELRKSYGSNGSSASQSS